MTTIKICGLTRLEDALFCADQGADYLGFIFVPSTPRFIEPERAAEITAVLRDRPQRPKFTGVFRDASPAYINDIAALAGLDFVQLHGAETDDEIRAIKVPAIKTFRVGDALPDTTAHPSAEWHLFDTYEERRAGGIGRRFDWSLLAMYERSKPFFLAGGMTPENVAGAISLVRPSGIDVGSGVESEPGVKDHEKVKRLFERIRRAVST
ncbi:MAG TPA: phosphoribosylanthranilate isomerase [Thermoanaerobaculia bacterium]|nr:phosphoribosylanthranilate isomerase [Thermoanaerobaculia bacterium]